MPTADSTTTAALASIGLTASNLYSTFLSMASQAISVGIWLIQVAWLPMLGLGVAYFFLHLILKFLGFGRRM